MPTLSQSRSLSSALIFAVGSAVATVLAFPYLLQIIPKIRESRLPLPWVAIAAGLQTGVLTLVLAWIGLRLGRTAKLGAPVIGAWLDGGEAPATRWLSAVLLGLATGALVVALDRLAFLRFQPTSIRILATTPAGWRGLLAAAYGGIVEEVMTRLFLTTLFVWLGMQLIKESSPTLVLAAAIGAAVLFAAAHLPTIAQIAPLDAAVVVRGMTLNTFAGIVFGFVYWRWGIEHAILCHFCADALIHTVAG